MTTLTLNLSEAQILELFGQLPADQKFTLFQRLLLERWPKWIELSTLGQTGARRLAAQRGLDWDALTDLEREALIDEIIHEGRA